MREIEFQEQFAKVIRKWPKAYSPEQVDMIFDSVKDMSFRDMGSVVNRILSSMKTAPTQNEIFEIRRGLGLMAVPVIYESNMPKLARPNGPTYLVRKGEGETITANNNYVYISRGEKSSFIVKKDAPDHALVVLSESVNKTTPFGTEIKTEYFTELAKGLSQK